jgi:hypothetical protein
MKKVKRKRLTAKLAGSSNPSISIKLIEIYRYNKKDIVERKYYIKFFGEKKYISKDEVAYFLSLDIKVEIE